MTDTDDFRAHYLAALRTYLSARDEDSLAVGHELGRRALQEQDQHARHRRAPRPADSRTLAGRPGRRAGRIGIPVADAGSARCRDPGLPGRHQALRRTAGPRRGSGRPRQVPHRPGEFLARGVLRRRPRRRGDRHEQRLRRDPRLSRQRICRTAGRTRGWSTRRRPLNNKPESAATAAPITRHRFAARTAILPG